MRIFLVIVLFLVAGAIHFFVGYSVGKKNEIKKEEERKRQEFEKFIAFIESIEEGKDND